MEHPLVGPLDNLTVDELSVKINELNKKLHIAQKMGNGHMCNQIRMALENYTTKYREKLEETYKKSQVNFDDKINIQ